MSIKIFSVHLVLKRCNRCKRSETYETERKEKHMRIRSGMSMKQVYSRTCLANEKFMLKLESILKISISDQATYQEQVLKFHAKYTTVASLDAFGISKATLYRWRKKYLKARKDATVLIPQSKRPRHVRQIQTD